MGPQFLRNDRLLTSSSKDDRCITTMPQHPSLSASSTPKHVETTATETIDGGFQRGRVINHKLSSPDFALPLEAANKRLNRRAQTFSSSRGSQDSASVRSATLGPRRVFSKPLDLSHSSSKVIHQRSTSTSPNSSTVSTPKSSSNGGSPLGPAGGRPAKENSSYFTQVNDEAAYQKELLNGAEQFRWRRAQPHHKHPFEEVPYMQSYSATSLQNDFHTFELLRRLCPLGSPTFHDYGMRPPKQVLDLGCGEGLWAAEAATRWKFAGTQVTAFDIVDLGAPLRHQLPKDVAKNIHWVRGNFLDVRLPFPDQSFELVRMACLALAVPTEFWEHLLREVKRVLTFGGRVEIVEDDIFFPETLLTNIFTEKSNGTTTPNDSNTGRCTPVSTASLYLDSISGSGRSTPVPGVSSRFGSSVILDRSLSLDSEGPELASGPMVKLRTQAGVIANVETLFKKMIGQKFQISLRPSLFLGESLQGIFEVQNPPQCFTISIPIRDVSSVACPSGQPLKTKQPSEFSSNGLKRNPPKALQLLLLRHYQPGGFVISPSTFVRCEPSVLEMYACKNIHALLSCKHALATYIEEHGTDENGHPWLNDEEFEQYIWEYDSYKRARFSWPQHYAGMRFEEGEARLMGGTPLGRHCGVLASSGETPVSVNTSPEDLVRVRTIHVFDALKLPPTALIIGPNSPFQTSHRHSHSWA